jgi:hypothetical protein
LAERSHSSCRGPEVLLRQFARNIDKALRPLLTGSGIPLVLAAAEPLASVYRSVNTYTGLAEATIEGSPEAITDAELGERARTVLDGLYREELGAVDSMLGTSTKSFPAESTRTVPSFLPNRRMHRTMTWSMRSQLG